MWNTLASTYAKWSRGHIKQLKTQLKNSKKENKTIDDYLQGITARLDPLATLGKVVDHEDQIDLILEVLPEDYKYVMDHIEGRDVPSSITELHERLLNHEAKILSVSDALVSPTPVTANMAQQCNNTNNYKLKAKTSIGIRHISLTNNGSHLHNNKTAMSQEEHSILWTLSDLWHTRKQCQAML